MAAVDPARELVEWVADDGSVIEVVTRARMRAERLSHRCTYVVVVAGPRNRFAGRPQSRPLRADDEVVVHLRADWKDVCPSHWDLAFGGVCGVEEDWERSARRELAEEAGIELGPADPLIDLGPTRYDDVSPDGDRPGATILGRAYMVSWPDPPVSTDGEAVAFGRVPIGGLGAWLDSVPVCPDSRAVVTPALLARLDAGSRS